MTDTKLRLFSIILSLYIQYIQLFYLLGKIVVYTVYL